MDLTPEQIEKNRNNPEILQRLVDNLTKVIELDKEIALKKRTLRWEFTRQLHLVQKKFWLEGVTGMKLMKIYKDWNDEYELVFDKQSPFIGFTRHEAEDWKFNQKKKYDKIW